MDGINGTLHRVKTINKSTFLIGDTTTYSPYVRNGTAKLIKTPIQMKFLPLENVL